MTPSDYTAAGFAPIRLYGVTNGICDCRKGPKCGGPGKHPIDEGWPKTATTDEFIVRERFEGHRGNIGLAVSKGMVVLDCDGLEGLETYAALQAPETLCQTSGRGGHYFFRLKSHHEPIRNVQKNKIGWKLKGIDIRGPGGQVVVEPSMHANGTQYTWDNWGVPIAELPDHIYDQIKPDPVVYSPPPSNVVAIGSGRDVFKMASRYVDRMDSAVSGQGGHDAAWRVARKLFQDFVADGLSESDAWSIFRAYNARCNPPWSEKELEHKANDAKSARVRVSTALVSSYGGPVSRVVAPPLPLPPAAPVVRWADGLVWKYVKDGRKLLPTHANVVHILSRHPLFKGRIRRNELSNAVEYVDFPFRPQEGGTCSGEWGDNDTFRLMSRLLAIEEENVQNVEFKRDVVDAAVETIATLNAYHPVRDYLVGLEWDGTPRVNTWLARYLGTPGDAWDRMIGERFLVSAVARALSPGCKVDTVLILEGGQGAGKSTAIRKLFGDAWFSDTPIEFGTKDGYQGLAGKWCLELGELSTFTRRDLNTLKNFFSALVDDYRPSYGRRNVKYPRQCVFVGTTNQSTYLDDDTGNRRYWPVKVGKIDLSAIEEIRDQLWAEAYALFKAGGRWWLEREEEKIGEAPREARRSEDSWNAEIAALLVGKSSTTVGAILTGLGLEKGRWGRAEEMRVAKNLRGLGWDRVHTKTGWVYQPIQPDPT